MFKLSEIIKSIAVSAWFMFLTFPILVIKVNTYEKTIDWRWKNMILIGIASFFLSFLWRYMLKQKEYGSDKKKSKASSFFKNTVKNPKFYTSSIVLILCLIIAFPFVFSIYQTNIMTSALMYVVLGLGLNIVVGLAGLLDLGYVAFFAVGAYSYALLNHHFGITFFMALPIGALLGAFFGILLGFPVLRLKGDYLAIVTLGFGEIIRLILENWNDFSFGPSGIANIPKPSFFGINLSIYETTTYMYFIMILLVFLTVFVVNRLEDSRIGRAWIALKEDEVACQAMGIDKTKTKLYAFATGAAWAGLAGVVFAAKTSFINPASFTFLESAIILSLIVLGGMGSIFGVITGAFIFILLPEYLRAFSDYRMLVFGAAMVLMMVFRPQGIIKKRRRFYKISDSGGKKQR